MIEDDTRVADLEEEWHILKKALEGAVLSSGMPMRSLDEATCALKSIAAGAQAALLRISNRS